MYQHSFATCYNLFYGAEFSKCPCLPTQNCVHRQVPPWSGRSQSIRWYYVSSLSRLTSHSFHHVFRPYFGHAVRKYAHCMSRPSRPSSFKQTYTTTVNDHNLHYPQAIFSSRYSLFLRTKQSPQRVLLKHPLHIKYFFFGPTNAHKLL